MRSRRCDHPRATFEVLTTTTYRSCPDCLATSAAPLGYGHPELAPWWFERSPLDALEASLLQDMGQPPMDAQPSADAQPTMEAILDFAAKLAEQVEEFEAALAAVRRRRPWLTLEDALEEAEGLANLMDPREAEAMRSLVRHVRAKHDITT